MFDKNILKIVNIFLEIEKKLLTADWFIVEGEDTDKLKFLQDYKKNGYENDLHLYKLVTKEGAMNILIARKNLYFIQNMKTDNNKEIKDLYMIDFLTKMYKTRQTNMIFQTTRNPFIIKGLVVKMLIKYFRANGVSNLQLINAGLDFLDLNYM